MKTSEEITIDKTGVWRITPNLRWMNSCSDLSLQQKWINFRSGEEQWRNIPIIREENGN